MRIHCRNVRVNSETHDKSLGIFLHPCNSEEDKSKKYSKKKSKIIDY